MPELQKVTNPQNTTPAYLSSSVPNETEKKELEEILPQIKTLMAQYPVPKAFSQKLEEYDSKINQLIDQNKGSEKSPDEQKKAFEEIVKLERDRDVYQAYVDCALYEKTALTTNWKNTELFRKFSKLNEKFNLTSDPTSPGRELIKDALATLLAGFVTYFVLPEKVAAGAHWAIRASAFVGRATLFFTAHNAINYLTERHHAVDVSVKAFNLNLVTFLLLGASGKVVDTASRQAILKLLCKDPSKMAHMAKKLDLLLQRSTYLKNNIEAAKLPVDVFALTVLGVSQALSEGQLPKENTLEFIFNKIMLHNLIFVAMLKTGGLAASKALASERGQIFYNSINLKEQYRIAKANLAESIAKETNAEKKAGLLETQKELEELNQKVGEKSVTDAELVESIKTELQNLKTEIWESKSLSERLEKNTEFFKNKLKTIYEHLIDKYDPNGSLGLKNKIALYYFGSTSRGETPSSSDIDSMLVSSAEVEITQAIRSDLILMAYKAGISEAEIGLYFTNQQSVPIHEIPWQGDEHQIGKSYSFNAFNDFEADASLENRPGISALTDRKVLSGPDLLSKKLMVNKDKAQFRILSDLSLLPDYNSKPIKNPRFKDIYQRPLNCISWANKLGISKIDIQKETQQTLFIRQFLSEDTNNFADQLSESSFDQFFKNTENNPKLRQEFHNLFGNIKTFAEMLTIQKNLLVNIQAKTSQLIETIMSQEHVVAQIMAYSAYKFVPVRKEGLQKTWATPEMLNSIEQAYLGLVDKHLKAPQNFKLKKFNEDMAGAIRKINSFFNNTGLPAVKKEFAKLLKELEN